MVEGSDAVRGRMSGLMAGCLGLAGCPGCRAGCPGSGSLDELEELRVEEANSGKNSGDFVDGN